MLSSWANAQEKFAQYPVRFTQYYQGGSFVNPALAGTHTDIEVNLGNQRMSGNLSRIASYYALVNLRVRLGNRQSGPFS